MLSQLGRRNPRFFSGRSSRRSPLADVDLILWGVPLAMVAIAGILIASTQRQANYADWYQHWVTAAVGMVVALLLARMPLDRLIPFKWPIYIAMVASLVAVRVVGTSALGAQSWINIGGFYVQPSEFAKVGAILLLAGVLARHPVDRPVDLIRPVGLIALPLLLVGWVPLMGWLAWKTLPWKRVALAISLAVQGIFAISTPWLWEHGLRPHQRDRLTLFMDPAQDPLGGGYHLLQSTVGIGSGQIWGTGLMQGSLTKLRFIPEQHTDFIFSALGEETGFLGSVLVVAGFALLMGRLLQIAGRARSDYEALVVVGIGAMLMFQVVVNINMTIGLGPITGIPLPWLSYGRSAMLVNFISLGLCASAARRGRTTQGRW